MYRRAGNGYVLVITSSTHKTGTGKFGVNGQEIIVDVDFDPLTHAINHAEVFQLPFSVGHMPIRNLAVGSPGYGPISRPGSAEDANSMDIYAIGGVYNYRFTSDIHTDVEVGDKVYFKKRTLNSPMNQMGAFKQNGKVQKYLYKVPYENIYCVLRGTEMIMIGGWVLLEPIFEDWDDILRPTYYDYKDAHGQPIERPKRQWIKIKAAPQADNMRARVAYIGKPLKGDPCDIEVGEVVLFKRLKTTDFQVIEGKNYIVLHQHQIMASVTEDCKIT